MANCKISNRCGLHGIHEEGQPPLTAARCMEGSLHGAGHTQWQGRLHHSIPQQAAQKEACMGQATYNGGARCISAKFQASAQKGVQLPNADQTHRPHAEASPTMRAAIATLARISQKEPGKKAS